MSEQNTIKRPSATRKPATRRNKKRKKPPIHKGRLAIAIGVFLLIIGLIIGLIVMAYLYGTGKSIFSKDDDYKQQTPEAIEAGCRDAAKALQFEYGSMERQDALFSIKARETSLRQHGYNNAADNYIDAATDYLNSHNAFQQ